MRYYLLLFVFTFCINTIFSPHLKKAEAIYPSIFEVKIERSNLLDFWLLLLGSRKAASDYAWLRLMQYYGTHFADMKEEEAVSPHDHEHHEHVHIFYGPYYDLKFRSNAVIKLDPYYKYAYLYAAGALAFNQERYPEAVEILEFGTKYLPKYWRLQLYLSAISYKKKMEFDRATEILASGIDEPDCPMLIKNILAILYEEKGDYQAAKKMWLRVLFESNEEGYIMRAKKHLAKINNITTIKK